MSTILKPGEVVIEELFMLNSRGIFYMEASLMRASVFESIFKQGIYATFKVLDTDDALGDMRLNGNERVRFKFKTVDGPSATYSFAVNSVTLAESDRAGLQRSRTYIIECMSEEVIASRAGFIQKRWRATITAAVTDIFRNFIGSTKSLDAKQTQGVQELLISNKKPFTAIRELAGRASGQSQGSWVFFENREGYHFTPLEDLAKQGAVKTLRQHGAIGAQPTGELLNEQIINYKVVSKLQLEKAIKMGIGRVRVNENNQRTREYVSKIIKPSIPTVLAGGRALAKVGRTAHYSTTSRIPETGMPKGDPDEYAYAAELMQLVVHVLCMGDAVFMAGKTVELHLPKPVTLSTRSAEDELVKGTFLISKLRHEIKHRGMQPRYTCTIEAMQGGRV